MCYKFLAIIPNILIDDEGSVNFSIVFSLNLLFWFSLCTWLNRIVFLKLVLWFMSIVGEIDAATPTWTASVSSNNDFVRWFMMPATLRYQFLDSDDWCQNQSQFRYDQRFTGEQSKSTICQWNECTGQQQRNHNPGTLLFATATTSFDVSWKFDLQKTKSKRKKNREKMWSLAKFDHWPIQKYFLN